MPQAGPLGALLGQDPWSQGPGVNPWPGWSKQVSSWLLRPAADSPALPGFRHFLSPRCLLCLPFLELPSHLLQGLEVAGLSVARDVSGRVTKELFFFWLELLSRHVCAHCVCCVLRLEKAGGRLTRSPLFAWPIVLAKLEDRGRPLLAHRLQPCRDPFLDSWSLGPLGGTSTGLQKGSGHSERVNILTESSFGSRVLELPMQTASVSRRPCGQTPWLPSNGSILSRWFLLASRRGGGGRE